MSFESFEEAVCVNGRTRALWNSVLDVT